ncbi:hypothetical protein [Streptomyces sp. CC210A]|uniref:hypothetical protein n=1 Tax=Streptomyces sp. CC210A TaxID=2898184 RepID=UPI001F388B7D|nr:hypothetical protein [Streptomyces sp. CC210A]
MVLRRSLHPNRRGTDGQLHREIACFLVHAPTTTTVSEIIARAGGRRQIEEDNELSKQLVGFAQYQVRRWTPGTGTSPLACWPPPSSPFNAQHSPKPKTPAMALRSRPPRGKPGHGRERGHRLTPGPLLRPTAHAIRHCLAATHLNPRHPVETVLACEYWRHLHQTRALVSHYRRRGDPLPHRL